MSRTNWALEIITRHLRWGAEEIRRLLFRAMVVLSTAAVAACAGSPPGSSADFFDAKDSSTTQQTKRTKATRAAPEAAKPSANSDDYLIWPEDVLLVSVWKEQELQREVLVRPDGGISFPLVGDIKAGGKTPRELQEEITEKLAKYIPKPVVTVSVSKIAGMKIYVLGQVKNPGQYVIGRYIDVMQALALAGGVTAFADEDSISVIRRGGDKAVVMPFRYSDAKLGRGLDRNVILRSGDVVIVP